MTNLPFSARFTQSAKWLKRFVYILVSLVLLLLAVTGLMAFFATKPSPPHPLLQGYNTQPPKYDDADLNAAIGHLSQLLSVPTDITLPPKTTKNAPLEIKPFAAIQHQLQNYYPAFHALARRRILASGSILYFWPGTNNQLEPALWLSHLDVRPTPNAKEWMFPPFSGEITDAGVWGRGSLANKANLTAMLEALDSLARSGFKPQRGLYLAFSHDAESSNLGNQAISELLKKEGTHFSYILDDGGYVTERFLPQIEQPVAFIGIAEKGRISLHIDQHSNDQARIDSIQGQVFKTDDSLLALFLNSLAPYLSFKQRLAINNYWLFSGLIHKQAENNDYLHDMFTSKIQVEAFEHQQNAMTRISVDTFPISEEIDSDQQDRARLTQKIEGIISKTVSTKELIVKASNQNTISETNYKASNITPIEGKPYQLLWQSINQTYKNSLKQAYKNSIKQGKKPASSNEYIATKNMIVAPVLQLERSSASFYQELSKHILRFNYLPLSPETQISLSGVDEHITQRDLRNAMTFYYFFAMNTLIDY